MLVAVDGSGKRVLGRDADKNEEYYCQLCGQPVFPKKGELKIHHFAHYPNADPCEWWEPETEEHLQMKQDALDILKRDNKLKLAEPEYRLDLANRTLFPDIYLETSKGQRIAVECQVSNRSYLEFVNKTEEYTDHDIYMLWLFSGINRSYLLARFFSLAGFLSDQPTRDTISVIERQSHMWNFGRIYTLYRKRLFALHFAGVYMKDGEDYRPRMEREVSISKIYNAAVLCIENDGIKIARFFDRKWW